MADITVTGSEKDPLAFDVAVADGGRTHTYQVSVPSDLSKKFDKVEPDRLVHESFAFLLEREPPSSILSQFSLSVISRYFPEYVGEMEARLT